MKSSCCFVRPCTVFVLIVLGSSAGPLAAQPLYRITDIGLVGSEHTRNDGYKWSVGQQLNEAGQATGGSQRFNGGSTYIGQSAWLYNGTSTIDIGLTGSEHTRNDGYKYSFGQQLNEAGQVRGHSFRYNGGSTSMGQSVWLYNGNTTIDIGLTGAEHTRSDGYKYSDGLQLNEAGQVRGYSRRYNGGSTDLGQSAWLFDGTSTIDIGLTGAEHTRNDGYKWNVASRLNEAGQVLGGSQRFNGGSNPLGQSVWLFDGTSTFDIGLTGAQHTSSDGSKWSFGLQLNEAGQVTGYSWRYNGGSTELGRSAWLYDGTSTIDIGLTGAEHTRNNGYKSSQSQQLNEAGQVRGFSVRYNGGSTDLGQSVWLFDGTSTIVIGLTGAEHTSSDGYKISVGQHLNEAGQVRGYSWRYNGGSTELGQSAWLYNGTSTIDIGLTGAEHTRNDGYKYSQGLQLNEAGQVRGSSNRYNGGSTDLGQSAWLFDGTSTIDIGLTGAEHTRSDGYKYSYGGLITNSGYVMGYSDRYDGANYHGQDAWVYDPLLGTVALQLSVRSDGFAYSHAAFLSEEGVALGYYRSYSGMSLVGDRAFYWSASDGLWDLGSLIDGGLPANGWESLFRAIQGNGLGQILGYGLASGLPSGSHSAYLLTAIPEPSAATLALAGILVPMLLTGRRRRSSTRWQYESM